MISDFLIIVCWTLTIGYKKIDSDEKQTEESEPPTFTKESFPIRIFTVVA